MTWTAPMPAAITDDEPLVGPDRPMLEAFLAHQRRTLLATCAGLTGEQLDLADYREECAVASAAAAKLSFDDTFVLGGETYSVRLVHLHMVTEYAQHNGHADLLRQRIDGTTRS